MVFGAIAPAGAAGVDYYLVQSVLTYNESKFGAISTSEEAENIFSSLSGKVDGVEFGTLFYGAKDLESHRTVAMVAKKYGVDLWGSTFLLLERARAFGEMSPRYQAWAMRRDGTLYPAVEDGYPVLDVLNPAAMDWFLTEYKKRYLVPFRGLLNGYFLNENVIPGMAKWENGRRYEYWDNATYSPAVLIEWQKYCRERGVAYEGEIVRQFPVHRPEMASNGKGLTKYFPGYDAPSTIHPGQKYSGLPAARGVWKHWYDFISESFALNFINRLAMTANEVNRGNTQWRGVVYFGLHQWLLSYEQIKDADFSVPQKHRWGAWGRLRGLDLEKIAALPGVNAVICETYPPVEAGLEGFIKESKRIVESHGKRFGVMLHRDDRWSPEAGEELKRWSLIEKYSPSILARYPLENMLSTGAHYDPLIENIFDARLKAKRQVR